MIWLFRSFRIGVRKRRTLGMMVKIMRNRMVQLRMERVGEGRRENEYR